MGRAPGRPAPRPTARSTPTEEKLVTAIAVAMWKEIRADRQPRPACSPPCRATARTAATWQKRNALSLGTAIRYGTAAGMATQRAQRAFLAHRKAKQAGLILPVARGRAARNARTNCPAAARPEPAAAKSHERIPSRPAAAGRSTRSPPCAPASAACSTAPTPETPPNGTSPPPSAPLRLPGAPPYRGPIDLALLDRALEPLRFDAAALAWLATLALAPPPDARRRRAA